MINQNKPKIFDVVIGQKRKKEIFLLLDRVLDQSVLARPFWIVTLNPEILLKAEKKLKYQKILNLADERINDGFGLQVWSFIKGQKIGERLTGADLTEVILQKSIDRKLKIGLALHQDGLSSKKELESFLQKKGLKNFVVFSQNRDSFLENRDFPDNFKEIQVLLVGLGAPWQEKFIFQAIENNFFLQLKLAVGVGGTFDFWTGRQKRAPWFLRKIGLEWLWRLISQPRRIKRIWNAVGVFLYKSLKEV